VRSALPNRTFPPETRPGPIVLAAVGAVDRAPVMVGGIDNTHCHQPPTTRCRIWPVRTGLRWETPGLPLITLSRRCVQRSQAIASRGAAALISLSLSFVVSLFFVVAGLRRVLPLPSDSSTVSGSFTVVLVFLRFSMGDPVLSLQGPAAYSRELMRYRPIESWLKLPVWYQ